MRKEYIRVGKCIWCGKEKPEVTFNDSPVGFPEVGPIKIRV